MTDLLGNIFRLRRTRIISQFLLAVLAVPAVALPDFVAPSSDVTMGVVIRQRATTGSRNIGTLHPGDRAAYLGSVPGWHNIQMASGTTGYVSKRWTRIVSQDTASPTGSAIPSSDNTTPSYTIDVADVGTGLGILVRGKDFVLIYDGGSNDDLARNSNNRMLAYLRAVVPTLSTIDYLILSHPHRDHVELLPDLFGQYRIVQVWDSGAVNKKMCGYRAFLAAVRDHPGIQYHSAVQDFGTRSVAFDKERCYDRDLDAETIQFPHASRIDDNPIPLGQGASMTILHADGSQPPGDDFNRNSIVVRLDLADKRVLLMGDSEAGSRAAPSTPPDPNSIEGKLLDCCAAALRAQVLVVGHHGSKTSSRRRFLDAVGASVFVVSSGPTQYGSVVLPDAEVINEISGRGKLLRTDLNDNTCKNNPAKIGPDNDGQAGGCDNIRITIRANAPVAADYWRGADP